MNCGSEVESGGLVREHAGLNLPGVRLVVEPITAKDRADMAFGVALEVDYVAMSFVGSAGDVRLFRQELVALGSRARLIAKIEKWEALEQLEGIVAEADAVMVARGDLGVELPAEEVPLLQKLIIRTALAQGKAVITATQMLESMTASPVFTRAEASDVANAVLDGTSAVMLSEETAMGAVSGGSRAGHGPHRVPGREGPRGAPSSGAPGRLRYGGRVLVAGRPVSRLGRDHPRRQLRRLRARRGAGSGHHPDADAVRRHRPRGLPLSSRRCPSWRWPRTRSCSGSLPWSGGSLPLAGFPTRDTEGTIQGAVDAARRHGLLGAGDLGVVTAGTPNRPGSTQLIRVVWGEEKKPSSARPRAANGAAD